MTQILIVDDHPIARSGIRQYLQQAMPDLVIGEAADGEELMARLHTGSWDLVILDLYMPKKGGLSVLAEMKSLYPQLPVLVVSMHAAEQFARRVLQMGAAGYLSKSDDPELFQEAVKKILAGSKYITQAGAEQWLAAPDDQAVPDPVAKLTPREFQAMRLLGMGKPVKEVASSLGISTKTVLFYKHHVLRKLGLSSQEELALFCARHNLVPWQSDQAAKRAV